VKLRALVYGDLHLGAGTALGREPGDRLRDQADVLDKIIDVAHEREVNAILLAGDVFEGPLVTPEQMDVFASFIGDAHEVEIPIVAISGNGTHDQAMRTVNGLAIFNRIPGITVYSRPALHDLGPVHIACLPWVSPARLVASMDGDVERDRVNQRAAELLVKAASGIADPRIKPTVLMLHGSLSGASLPAGISTDELREPVIPVEELVEQGWAAIIAAHIHVPQVHRGDGWTLPPADTATERHVLGVTSPLSMALYTGSPMPLNFGETTVPHGVWIIDIGDELTGAEFVPVESRPLRQTTLDLAALATDGIDPLAEFDGILDANAWPDVDEAIVKIVLRCTQTQQRRLDLARLRKAVIGAGAHTVKIDVDTAREQRSRVDAVTDELDPLEAFDLWVKANEIPEGIAHPAYVQMADDLEQVGA
jgi:DNA repair exonuclease SbcCD nuclease subunit